MAQTLATQPVGSPKGEGYNAQVAGRWLRTAPDNQQPIRAYTRDSLAQRQQDSASPAETVLDIGYAFARTDLTGGQGLDWDPRQLSIAQETTAMDELKFWDSDGIDVRRRRQGEPYSFQLSKLMDSWDDRSVEDACITDDHMLFLDGTNVEWWAAWGDVAADKTRAVGAANPQHIVASIDGEAVAVKMLDGTVRMYTETADAFAAVSGLTNVEHIWYVKGRFIASTITDGVSSLIEFDSTGASADGAFDVVRGRVLDLCSAGPAIVAAVTDGTLRTYVPEQRNTNDPASMGLVVRGITDLPNGEVPTMVAANAGVLLVLTATAGRWLAGQPDIRLYRGEVLDERFDYTVGGLSIVSEWFSTEDRYEPRGKWGASRDEIWFVVNEDASSSTLFRFDLVTFGLSRHVTIQRDHIAGVFFFDGRIGAVEPGTAVIYESDSFVDSGWLIGPNVNFGLNTDISWLALVLQTANLATSGKQVELWYTTDRTAIQDQASSQWKLGIRQSSPSQKEREETLTDVTSKSVALMVRVFSAEAASRSPQVERFAIRGIPTQRDWILELPINVSDLVEVPFRRPAIVPGYGYAVHNYLVGLAGQSIRVSVLDPPFEFAGVVDNIVEPTTYVTERGSASVRAVLQCRGSRVSGQVTATGDAGLGIGLLGGTTLGIGQTGRT